MEIREVAVFVGKDGQCPFEDWLGQLKDKRALAAVLNRIDRIRLGNFGDCKSVGRGVFELRVHLSPGYRVYFGIIQNELILLLAGGSKKTQRNDINRAALMLEEYKNSGHKNI